LNSVQRRSGHGARKLSETALRHVDSRIFYHVGPVIVLAAGMCGLTVDRTA